MRDYRKFCRPKTTKHPEIGDVQVRLNCGSTVYVKTKDYLNVKKSFKINSVVGEVSNTAGNIKVLDKLLNREIIISVESYAANPDRFELINIIGSKFDPYNGHDYVELNGIKWATVNVGAEQSSDSGLFFQWGDTQGYTVSQVGSGEGLKYFDWADYKWTNDSGTTMTKYNSIDNKANLEIIDDAVQANWGGAWRTPTIDEFIGLVDNCNLYFILDEHNVPLGKEFVDKDDPSKVIFIPYCGQVASGITDGQNNYAMLWSSSIGITNKIFARSLNLIESTSNLPEANRCLGFPVRGIIDENLIPDEAELILTGDIIVHNNVLNRDEVFSYSNWLNLSDDWDLVGLYNITTYEEEDAVDGDYVIMANGHTLIIKPEDYSKVSDNWELVDVINVEEENP